MCGQSLITCEAHVAPSDVLELQAAFLTGPGPQAASAISQLGLAQWVQLFLRIAALLEPNRKGRTGQVAGMQHLSATVVVVQRAAKILLNWPTGFHALLAEIQAQGNMSFSLPRTFGRMYRWLYVDLAANEYAFLREGFESYLRENWWGLVCRRNKRVLPTTSGPPRTTIRDAARLAGTTPTRVKQLHLAGMIEATTIAHDSGRQSWSLPTSVVTDLAGIVSNGMTLKAASIYLALPKHRVRELIQAGLIRPRLFAGSNGSSTWLLSRDELDRLGCVETNHHTGHPQSPGDGNSVSILQVLKAWHLAPGSFPALMAALAAGEIAGVDARPCHVPLGKMSVPVNGLRVWLSRWRVLNLGDMSITAAAQVLRIKEQVAYALVRIGLLKACVQVQGNSRRISAAAISQFNAKYVAATEIGHALGTSPKAFLARTSIQPAAGPTINDCRQYFFRRSDVECLLIATTPQSSTFVELQKSKPKEQPE